MKAPDKIYLRGYSFDDEPCVRWEREKSNKAMRGYKAEYAEYIRKDALLKWAKQQEMQALEDLMNDLPLDGKLSAFRRVVEKIESM